MYAWGLPDDLDRLEEAGARRIAATVLEGRLRRGLSERQLAWRVGLAQSTISRLENGKLRGIRFKRLAAIVAVHSSGPDFRLADGPPAPTRRLPGQPPP